MFTGIPFGLLVDHVVWIGAGEPGPNDVSKRVQGPGWEGAFAELTPAHQDRIQPSARPHVLSGTPPNLRSDRRTSTRRPSVDNSTRHRTTGSGVRVPAGADRGDGRLLTATDAAAGQQQAR